MTRPLENGNMRLVDVPFLFGNCDADAADKANYYFRQTDDYLATCRRCGSDIIYRLGVSIEHGIGRYYAFPPEDFEKWSDICVNIVRHYNEGWNDGFAWNIRYWEIWNEPDLAGNMWNAPLERYFELYALTAKKLKARFPGIRVGGPAYACCDPGGSTPFSTPAAPPTRRSTSSAGTATRPTRPKSPPSRPGYAPCSTRRASPAPSCT